MLKGTIVWRKLIVLTMSKRLCDTGHIRGKVSFLKIRYHHLKLARPNGWDGSHQADLCGSTDFKTYRYEAAMSFGIPDLTAGLTRRLPLDLVRILATRRTQPLSPENTDCAFHPRAFHDRRQKSKSNARNARRYFESERIEIREGFQKPTARIAIRLITFDGTSDDRNIRKALMAAKEVRLAVEAERKAAREAQLAPPASAPVLDRSQY